MSATELNRLSIVKKPEHVKCCKRAQIDMS
jgi:hypothetical protein